MKKEMRVYRKGWAVHRDPKLFLTYNLYSERDGDGVELSNVLKNPCVR